MNERDPELCQLAARGRALWPRKEMIAPKRKSIQISEKNMNEHNNPDEKRKIADIESMLDQLDPSTRFEELLSDLVNCVLSRENVRADIKRRSPGFLHLVRLLCRFYAAPAEKLSEKQMSDFESFFKFYLLRSDFAHIKELLSDLQIALRGQILSGSPNFDIMLRVLKMMSLMTSFNSFGDDRAYFLTAERFLGFEVPNRFMLGLDYMNPSFLTGHDLLLPLHLNHHFSMIIQFLPCPELSKNQSQTLISFENSNKGLRPFWGWSIEIRDDKLLFILHKFQESPESPENREEFQVMHFPNRLLFFGRWNTLCISCRNDLHFKESNLTFMVNGQAKSLKLSINRETLFHCMNKSQSSFHPKSYSFSPCIAVHFLLNKLVICRGFRGKLSRVLVFKGDMKSNDLESLDQKLSVLSDFDSVRSYRLLQEWMKENHFLGKLIFDLSAFDVRGHRNSMFGALMPILENLLVGGEGLGKIGEVPDIRRGSLADQNDDEDAQGFTNEEEIELLRRYSIQISDSASFADIHFTPIHCVVDPTKESFVNSKKSSSELLKNDEKINNIQNKKRYANLPHFMDLNIPSPSFTFEFDLCSNDPFHFDFSLFQQNLFDPLLSCLPVIATFEKSRRGALLEIWTKCLTNFLSKPKLCSHFSTYYLKTKIMKKLLAAHVSCATRHPDFPLMPPKVCDIFLENLNSLDLPVSGTMLNNFLLDRCFLFQLARTPAHLTYVLSKLSVWLYKYKNLRKALNWQLLLDNIVFFLSISDFSASKSRGMAHFNLSAQLSTFFLLFFPFTASQNESLLLFHRQLGLDTQFALFGFLFGKAPPPPNKEQQWPLARFEAVTNLIGSISMNSQNEKNAIKLDLKMVLYSLASPLLTKSPAKTGLLLDLLFLLIERHGVLPTGNGQTSLIPNRFTGNSSGNSKQQFDAKKHYASTFRSLFFELKNNSSRVLIRSLALLIKSGHSFALLPPSFFSLRKFINRSTVNPMYLSLHDFMKDSSIRLRNSSALVEYLFSVFFQNYSLSGFFDHERLSLIDPEALTAFFSLTRYLQTASIEKSLQIFSILLQHNTKSHFFPFFSTPNALCGFLDLLFRFCPWPQNSLFLKLKLFEDLKNLNKETKVENLTLEKAQIPTNTSENSKFGKISKASISSMRKSEILKTEDFSDLLVYFSSLKIDIIPYLKHIAPKPAVFDLSLRVIRLLQLTCLDSMNDLVCFCYHVCFFSSYFKSLNSSFLQTRVLRTSMNQLFAFQNKFKLEEPLILSLIVCQQSLTKIDFSFFTNSVFLSQVIEIHFGTISLFLKVFLKSTISRFDEDSGEVWFKKMRFRFLSSDRRFPADLDSIIRTSQFSFAHILVGSDQIKVRAKPKLSQKDPNSERALETIFVLSHVLYEVLNHFERLFQQVKQLKLSKASPLGEKMDVKLIEVIDVLTQHFQLVLLLSRHSHFRKKKVKWQPVFDELIVRLFKLFLRIFEHVDFLQPEDKWKMLKILLLEPFQILSSSKVVCVETLGTRTESIKTSFLPIYVISSNSFKDLACLSSLCLRTPFHFLLNPDFDVFASPKNNQQKPKTRHRKSEKGFFSMLAKGFRKENRIFKKLWKDQSFLSKMAREIYLITTQENLDLEKIQDIKGFSQILDSKLIDWSLNSKNKQNQSMRERYQSETPNSDLSPLSRSQAMQNNYATENNPQMSKRIIRISEKKSKSLFSGFFGEIERQISGKLPVHTKDLTPNERSDKKWLTLNLEKPASFEFLEKEKKSKRKAKKKLLGREKLSVMNQSFLLSYQQVLGTLSFEFEESLVNLFRENYKMNKSLYGAKGRFSLLEAPFTDYLRFRVENSLKRDFEETIQINQKVESVKESSYEESCSAANSKASSKKDFEFQKKPQNSAKSNKSGTSEAKYQNPKSNEKLEDLSDSDSLARSAVSADCGVNSEIQSQISDFESSKITKSMSSIRLDTQGKVRRESVFNRKINELSRQTSNAIQDGDCKEAIKNLKVHIKQQRMTTRNFQRPFVKAQIRFDSASEFALKSTLSKPGRRGLILIFKSHFNVVQKINSYLKAFFEMEKFSLKEPAPKKKNRRRRNQAKKEPLPFSAVLHYARFRQIPHLEGFVVRPYSSLPCMVLFKGEELWVCLTDLARERKHHLELKQTIFKPDKGLIRKYSIPKICRVFEYKFLHCNQAVHILFRDHSSLILHFHTTELRAFFLRKLSVQVPGAIEKSLGHKNELRRQNIRNQWAYFSKLSNFSLVALLNLIGARSLDDFSQYPVFPLVISKAEPPELEWRDLAKPVGMIGDPNKIRLLSQKFKKSDNFDNIPPYFYGSHYSSPATTFHFLLRLKPFDAGAKSIQNGRFDLPDRLFHSWDNVLDNIQKETSDVRECPPELYYQPLFFINLNDLDFGVNQSGERVDHVITPELIGSCPFKFVFKLRQALESKRVSQNLGRWVDLIFGSNQLDERAEMTHNVFFYLTYQHSKTNIDNARKRDQEALETQVFHFGQTPFQLTDKPWPARKCLDLSVVSSKFTKKYFVKKVFYKNFDMMVSTCEFCLQKIKDEDPDLRAEQVGIPKMFCQKCRLCSECSNGHLKYEEIWDDQRRTLGNVEVAETLNDDDVSIERLQIDEKDLENEHTDGARSRPRSGAISKGKASMKSDDSDFENADVQLKEDFPETKGIQNWQEKYRKVSDRSLHNDKVKQEIQNSIANSSQDRNSKLENFEQTSSNNKLLREKFETNNYDSVRLASKSLHKPRGESKPDDIRPSNLFNKSQGKNPRPKIKNPFKLSSIENPKQTQTPESNNPNPQKNINKSDEKIVTIQASLNIIPKDQKQTSIKNLFEKHCEFCVQRENLETKLWMQNGAPHENAVLMIKEISFMDLERKYISKVAILRPYKIDYYTFVLFKADKSQSKKQNQDENNEEIWANEGVGKQHSKKETEHEINEQRRLRMKLNEQIQSQKNVKGRNPRIRMAGLDPKTVGGNHPSGKANPPFELNLNKSLSLEKLRMEMRNWGLLGTAHSLWTRIGSFELHNHIILLGGCCLGTFRLFSVKKNRLLYEFRLHKFMIEQVSLSIQCKVLTRDQTGVMIISQFAPKPQSSKPYLIPLYSVHQNFGASLSHLKFSRLDDQIFFGVSQTAGQPLRLKLFDSEKEGAILTDLTLEIDRFGSQEKSGLGMKSKIEFAKNAEQTQPENNVQSETKNKRTRKVSIQGGRGSLIYTDRRESVPELRINSRKFKKSILEIENRHHVIHGLEPVDVATTSIGRETKLAFSGLGTVLEYIDLSFGYLNCIVMVVRDDIKGEYVISTKTLEGVALTTFCIKIKSKDHLLSSFMLFKDCFFQDNLACMNQKGDIYFFDLPYIENVKMISSKVRLSPKKIQVIAQSKAIVISDSEGLLHFYTVLPNQPKD